MRYEGTDRYQFQPWPVKAWRRLRYMPPAYLAAVWCVFRWAARGAPVGDEWYDDTRAKVFRTLWKCSVSGGHIRMGWCWSLEECIGKLRARRAH